MSVEFSLANVFSQGPLTGNPLPVVFSHLGSATKMQQLAREFNQTETIYIEERNGIFHTRIFTIDSELPFAGHPLLGATAAIHAKKQLGTHTTISLKIPHRNIELKSECLETNHYQVSLDQGPISTYEDLNLENKDVKAIMSAFALTKEDLLENLPITLASTGLPYAIIPVTRQTLERLELKADISSHLTTLGAAFTYVFTVDEHNVEARSFDNKGLAEDPATGSAAGPLADYLVKNGLRQLNSTFEIKQGRFCHRSSVLKAIVDLRQHITISGEVLIVGKGQYSGFKSTSCHKKKI